MRILRDLRITLERFLYRIAIKNKIKKDNKKKFIAIRTADKISQRQKIRLWVLKHGPGDYRIYTKPEIKTSLRKLGLIGNINIYQTGEYIIHISGKPKEN